jgi:hypothetical protein
VGEATQVCLVLPRQDILRTASHLHASLLAKITPPHY